MTLRCGSCGANLRVPSQILESGKTSARCPRCSEQVPFNQEDDSSSRSEKRPTIRVECGSCGAKLRAPAEKEGTSARCPKCNDTIAIRRMAPPAPPGEPQAPMAADAESRKEESGIATRRIDSRTLGMMGMETAGPATEVDLDDLVRNAPPPPSSETTPEATASTQGPADIATALMNPPVEDMKKAAESIREGSREIPAGEVEARSAPEPTSEASRAPLETPARRTAQARQPARAAAGPSRRRFPVFRGLLAGGASGTLLGAAWMALETSPVSSSIEAFIAPLPLAAETFGMAESVVRLVLLALLGSLVGLVAGAFGAAPGGNAIGLTRCLLIGALAGAALGLSGGTDPEIGFRLWPLAHWVRDFLIVGLLTPALNRVIPGE